MKEYPALPNRHLGYLFSVGFLIYEFTTLDQPDEIFIGLTIALTGWGYFMFVVYQIHKGMHIYYDGNYPTSPAKAAFMHIVPLYNLFWLYKWPGQMARFVWDRDRARIFPENTVAPLLLVGVLLSRFDYAIGYAILWTGVLLMLKGVEAFWNPLEKQYPSAP